MNQNILEKELNKEFMNTLILSLLSSLIVQFFTNIGKIILIIFPIHNFFFPHLAYELLGFYKNNGNLFAVVKQTHVYSTEMTNLKNVKDFLLTNGFLNKRNNDYYNPELGLIIEDLHDENVLTENGVLQFIDTVFYLSNTFYDI